MIITARIYTPGTARRVVPPPSRVYIYIYIYTCGARARPCACLYARARARYGHCTSTPIIGSRRYLYCFYCSPSRFHPLLSLLYYIPYKSYSVIIITIVIIISSPLPPRSVRGLARSQYRLSRRRPDARVCTHSAVSIYTATSTYECARGSRVRETIGPDQKPPTAVTTTDGGGEKRN